MCLQGRTAALGMLLKAKVLHQSRALQFPALVLGDTKEHGTSRSSSQIGEELPGAAPPHTSLPLPCTAALAYCLAQAERQ